jgi:microcompartment protein CcmK/EutM
LKLAKVVGNIVSTVKEGSHEGYKLMLVRFIDEHGKPAGPRRVAFDGARAGPGDIVLVNTDGGAARTILDDEEIICDLTICGVADEYTLRGNRVKG